MAELTTTIRDWKTTEASNKPQDAVEIDGTDNPGTDYAGLGNVIRDTKRVVRSESLDLGWDPASTIEKKAEDTSSQVAILTETSADRSKALLKVSPKLAKWKRCVEGQMFKLSVRQEVYTTTPATYRYYTGYISSIKSVFSGPTGTDQPGAYTYLLCTGMHMWTEDSTDAGYLVKTGVVEFQAADLTGMSQPAYNDSGFREATLEFSAYPPTQNGAYQINRGTLGNAANDNRKWLTTRGLNESALRNGERSALPRRRQTGYLQADNSTANFANVLTATFPYPEPDTNYTVSLVPVLASTTINSTNYATFKDFFTVLSIKKSTGFFTVEFGITATSLSASQNIVSWQWEIARSYPSAVVTS